MKNIQSRLVVAFLVVSLASLCPGSSPSAQEAKGKHDAGSVMEMHHLQILINHGLEMLIGANLVMLAAMKTAPGLDQETLKHGRSMMEQGKKTIQQILSGPELQAMHRGDSAGAPLTAYTHDLAVALLKVADELEKLKIEEMNQDTMTLHHFHLLFNQALETATVGSNLIMVGQMGMTGDIVKSSVEHGKMMLANARSVIIEVMGSKVMTGMHAREAGKTPEMGPTHKLASVALDVMDLLDEMPPGK